MHQVRSGFRGQLFQRAERQCHAAVVAERELCGQAARRHPLRRFAGETIVRGPGGQADGFDLTQGERRGKPRACRLEECLFGGKISRRAGSLMGGSPPGGPGFSLCTKAQRGLLCRAEHPPNKGRAMGPGEAFFHPGDLTQVAPNAI